MIYPDKKKKEETDNNKPNYSWTDYYDDKDDDTDYGDGGWYADDYGPLRR